MTIDRRVLVGALGLSLVLAACGGSGSAPAATSGAAATPAPAATEAPPTEAPATEEATEVAAEETPDDNGGLSGGPLNDLAAMLPERVGDTVFERTGFDGDQLGAFGAMAGISGEQLDPILQEHGKTLNDVNFAIAASSGNQAAGMIYAMQVEGVPAADLMGSMGMDAADLTTTTVGGKTVYTQGGGGFGIWAYPKDDVLFVILLATDEIAEGLLEQLP